MDSEMFYDAVTLEEIDRDTELLEAVSQNEMLGSRTAPGSFAQTYNSYDQPQVQGYVTGMRPKIATVSK